MIYNNIFIIGYLKYLKLTNASGGKDKDPRQGTTISHTLLVGIQNGTPLSYQFL